MALSDHPRRFRGVVDVSFNEEAGAIEVDVEIPGIADGSGATVVTPFVPVIFYFGPDCRYQPHASKRCTMGQHERGHALQYWEDYALQYPGYGWCVWWAEIGLPSLISASSSGAEDHAAKSFEDDATDRGLKTTKDVKAPGAK